MKRGTNQMSSSNFRLLTSVILFIEIMKAAAYSTMLNYPTTLKYKIKALTLLEKSSACNTILKLLN